MNCESLLTKGWSDIVSRLGGAEALEKQARSAGAFSRARGVKCAVDLLQLTLAYCLSGMSFRTTSAWACATGLARLSDVALIKRIRKMDDWLTAIINQILTADVKKHSQGRVIRLIDMTSVLLAGKALNESGKQWRIHSVFDLPSERFSFFELTDQSTAERLDCADIIPGEIRIGDRAYLYANRMAKLIDGGADFIIRARWNGLRWLDKKGQSFDLIKTLQQAGSCSARKSTSCYGREPGQSGRIDRQIKAHCKGREPLDLRLIAVRKPPEAAKKAREKVMKDAKRKGNKIRPETLIAADWVILVTTLDKKEFGAKSILELYRVRWRIELAFKRLKSLIGLRQPPTPDERLAKPFILVHLLMTLLLDPLIDEFEISPRVALRAQNQQEQLGIQAA